MSEMSEVKNKSESYLLVGYIGIICMVIGVILLFPLLILIPYPEEANEAKNFIIPGTLSITAGYFMSLGIRGKQKERQFKNQANLIVALAWLLVIVWSSVPFMLTGKYNFTQAVFECTSGYTTTGLSVVDVTQTSHIFLFFRTVMLFVGGVGLVLVVISVLSDRYGMKLFEAEGHSDKMLPNLIQSARMIILIYSGYILGGTILYMIFGMNWFDAVNHSVAAISTGGFSTRAESIGYYNSMGIEAVTIVLMFLGSMSFLVHLAFLRGKWKKVFCDCEVRFSLVIYPCTAVLMAGILAAQVSTSFPEGIRIGLFQAVSAMTTTGFQTIESFQKWPPSLLFIIIILMIVGGGAGSTAGGMKQYRVWIALREVFWNFKRRLSSKRIVFPHKIVRCGDDIEITGEVYRENTNFLFLYLLLLTAGTFILTCYGNSPGDSMFEIASSLSTVGLSAGITGYDAEPIVLWTSTVCMFLGRLEIYIIIITMVRSVRSCKNKLRSSLKRVL